MYKRFTLIIALGTAGCVAQPVAQPTSIAVFFQPFSVRLDRAAITAIANAATAAKEAPDVKITLVGTADNTGTSDHNKALSMGRSEAVLSQLAADGVDQTRIHVYGIGALGHLSDMTQFDRRVVIKFED